MKRPNSTNSDNLTSPNMIQDNTGSGSDNGLGPTLELISILLAKDGEMVSIMREKNPILTAKMLRQLCNRQNMDSGAEADDNMALLQLCVILPKCDEQQVNELVDFLLTTEQIQQMEDNELLFYDEGKDEECFPFDTLAILLERNSVKKVGEESARALRNQLTDVLAIILDALSFYSQKANRLEKYKQFGTIKFCNAAAPSLSSNSSSSREQQQQSAPTHKRSKPVSSMRGRRGKKRGRVQFSGRVDLIARDELDHHNDEWEDDQQRKNDNCIESILKALNNFFLDSQIIQMEFEWLKLLFRSCARNFVRAYLMNGDVSEITRLCEIYGALFQFLETLANANPVYVRDTRDLYGNEHRQQEQKQPGQNVPNANNNNGWRGISAVVNPLEQVLGEDTVEANNNTNVQSSSVIAAAALGQPILQQLRTFSRAIDEHFKLVSNAAANQKNAQTISTSDEGEDGADGEELMRLSSLSTLSKRVINTVEHQKQMMELSLTPMYTTMEPPRTANKTTLRKGSENPKSDAGIKSVETNNDTGGTGVATKLIGSVVDGIANAAELVGQAMGGSNANQAMGDTTSSSSQQPTNGMNASSGTTNPQNVNDEHLDRKYRSALKELQFASIPFDGPGQQQIPYFFRSKFGTGSSTGTANQRLKRVSKELFTLRSDLPLTFSSAVFVRSSEEHMDALKVLITGPEGTPYESGCFEFDFFLDANFPQTSPKVQFITTGNGTVRFNPNLYNCGKVCLSLLGTWRGDDKSQEWNAAHSTISQVITSIQGLILVHDPYFNEPGFEQMRGTPRGTAANNAYNVNIQQQTLRWAIIEQMRNPPRGFEEVVRQHFWLKRDKIMAQMESWGAMNGSIMTLRGKLIEEFEKLYKLMKSQ